MNDEFLIQKYLAGDVGAFNTLVWRWEKPIFNFILRYIGDADLSKDVMQQTFIRSYRSLKKLKDHRKFSTWLFQIALNLCRDELKRNRHTMLPIDEARCESDSERQVKTVLTADPREHPGALTESNDLALLLKQALQQIPEEQRVVIIMKQYHGLKFTEIADILKEPLNTIKSRMYYGLTALRKVLEQWGLDREDLGYEV